MGRRKRTRVSDGAFFLQKVAGHRSDWRLLGWSSSPCLLSFHDGCRLTSSATMRWLLPRLIREINAERATADIIGRLWIKKQEIPIRCQQADNAANDFTGRVHRQSHAINVFEAEVCIASIVFFNILITVGFNSTTGNKAASSNITAVKRFLFAELTANGWLLLVGRWQLQMR